ncbi:MAG TPA: nucleoside monophosphate kinase [Actinomycetes bacterium]|jgi:adenylate kinase|nr:nucleoside monophosphate kinase [Actinomycetes bacterium]
MATLPPDLKRVLLVGPPGSGKGTLGPHLSEILRVPHVSSGKLLRASVASGDPYRIAEQVNRGHMVPDRIVAQVMAEHLEDGFVLDGYPRNVRQAAEMDRVLAADGRQIQLVLELIVPDEVASARLSRRARMESRSDDNPDTVAARLVTYRREAVPLLAHYADLVRRVSASGDLDEVFQRAERALSSLPKGARARQGAPSADF